MAIYELDGVAPRVAASAWVADTAQVIGKETLLKELADGEVFSDDFDVDTEMEADNDEILDLPAA